MAVIIEICPKCGRDLLDEVIYTYPPTIRKICLGCGWSWEDKRDEIDSFPFDDNDLKMETDNSLLNDFLRMGCSKEDSKALADLAVNFATSYNSALDITEATNNIIAAINSIKLENLKDLK